MACNVADMAGATGLPGWREMELRAPTIARLGTARLTGARAGVAEPSRFRIGMVISRLLLGEAVPKNARLFVAFPDDTRYERQLVPWDLRADWPKIAGEIGHFNSAAYLA